MALPDFSKNFAKQVSAAGGSADTSGVQREQTASQQPVKQLDIRYMLTVLLLTLSIIGTGVAFGLNAYLDREIATIEKGIGVLEETIKTNDILDLATFDKQVQTLKDLTVSRGGYSLLLTEVSRLVVPGVYYSSVSIVSRGGGYALAVKGVADSLTRYHQQIQRIEAAEGLLAEGSFGAYALQHTEGGGVTVSFTVNFFVAAAEVSEYIQ